MKFDKQIYISLSDHIAFAIKRYKKNMMIKNELLSEIRRVHKNEYKVALWALNFLNKKLKIELPEDEAGFIALHFINASLKLKIELPEDEAGFIALHFINASLNQTTTSSIESTKIVKDILNIIRYYFALEFNEDDLNYDRLLTHLKYFSKRIITNNQDNNSEDEFMNMVIKSYPEAYNCTLKIKEYIVNNYKYEVNSNEIVYLTLHIQRIISVAKENY